MNLNPSDYISTFALFVSILSALYAKKQSVTSEIASHNAYRAHLSDKHDKYRITLKKINEKHTDEISNLSQEAGNCLTSVINSFYKYDTQNNAPQTLPHLIHECSEMVYCAFNGQLGYQYGQNISWRFSQMMHIENLIDPCLNHFNKEFLIIFRARFYEDPNIYEEAELVKDKYFCNLIKEISERTNPAKSAELLLDIQQHLDKFNLVFNKLRPSISDSMKYLEKLIDESDLEHFKLYESPELEARLRYKKTTLDVLSCLRTHNVEPDYAGKYYNYVSVSIYNCAILHAIQRFGSWGWRQN